MKNYHLSDIEHYGEMNANGTILLYDQTWQLLYHNEVWKKEWRHVETTLLPHLQNAYLNHQTYVSYHCKNQLNYALIQYQSCCVEEQSCILLSIQSIQVNDVITQLVNDRNAINRERNDRMPCGLFSFSLTKENKLLFKHANAFCYHMLGYEKQETTEGIFFSTQVMSEEDYEQLIEKIKRVLKQKETGFAFEYRAKHRDGTQRWLLARFALDVVADHMLGNLIDITKQKEMIEQLQISEEIKRIALRQGNLMILCYDIASKTLYLTDEGRSCEHTHCNILNYPEYAITNEIVSLDTREEFLEFYEKMHQGIPKGEALVQLRSQKNQNFCWIKAQYTLLFGEDNEPKTAIISYEDHSDVHEKELAYHAWKQNFADKKASSFAYYEYDLTNDIFEHIEGTTNEALPCGERYSFSAVAEYAATHFVYPKDREAYLRIFSRAYLLCQYEKGNYAIYHRHRRMDEQQRVFWAQSEIQLVLDPYTAAVKASVLLYNIDDEVKQEQKLRRSSERDFLTGVYNRETFLNIIQEVTQHKDHPKMLILLDLDHFKELNDSLGHQYGDMVLREMASRMNRYCKKQEQCSRIGGDEFMLLLEQSAYQSRLAELNRLLQAEFAEHKITASIGVAMFPQDGDTFDTLYTKADHAMYEAKRNGRNQYAFYQKHGEQ